ncbi:MAG: ABC transporter ATP-binding protein [bacterium]
MSIITVKELTKNFGDFVSVNKISFEVDKGEILGFLGANGAGKTTTIRMLCGLLKPSSGTAVVAGYDIYKESEEIKQSIGYMSQKFSLYENLTIEQNIRFYSGIYGLKKSEIKEKTEMIVEKFGISKWKKSNVEKLPLGWKQKLSFALALVHNPKIIFLDEPTGGVDPIIRRQFWDLIYEASNNGTTIFVTTHYMDEAEYCNRVSIMVDGEIKALGTPKELKAKFNSQNMDGVFQILARGTVNKE